MLPSTLSLFLRFPRLRWRVRRDNAHTFSIWERVDLRALQSKPEYHVPNLSIPRCRYVIHGNSGYEVGLSRCLWCYTNNLRTYSDRNRYSYILFPMGHAFFLVSQRWDNGFGYCFRSQHPTLLLVY